MNTLFTKSVLTSAIALGVIACGPTDNGGLAGIGGSGYVSSGSISGFGSVFVNGIEFDTDSATFDVDGLPGTQDDLAIGMVVQINGTLNDDGVTGTATNISFDDQLQGPVTNLTAPDADDIRSFIVLGTKVIISNSGTTFDIDDDLPANTIFKFDPTITNNVFNNNNNIEISGFFDSNGDINATRVELKDINFDVNNIVEIKGTITALSGTTFTLGILTVDASTATLEDLPNGLANGLLVEVKGTLDVSMTNLFASEVKAEDNVIDDIDDFELEGIITDYVDDSNFKINGTSIDASNTTREPISLVLKNDIRIKAEGAVVNGVLIADKIESEGGDLKVDARVTSVNVATNTFEVTPNPTTLNQSITISVTSGTQLEDDVNNIEPFTLNDLQVNNFVEVRGFDDGNGGITANEIDITSPDETLLQGIIQSLDSNSIQVLGVEFTIQNPGQTEFEDLNDNPLTPTEFLNQITLNSTLIKIEDDDNDGVANKIELETP